MKTDVSLVKLRIRSDGDSVPPGTAIVEVLDPKFQLAKNLYSMIFIHHVSPINPNLFMSKYT